MDAIKPNRAQRRHPETQADVADALWSMPRLAAYLGVPIETVRRWRSRSPRSGPPGVRIGKHVRFRPADVEAWIDQQAEARS